MSISINNNALPTQPTMVMEEYLQIQSEQIALDGSMSRNKIGQKRQATIEIPYMSPVDYQTALAYFITGSGVYYSNNTSNYAGGTFAFSGLPFFSESEYVQGGTLFRTLKVRVREA